MDTITLNDVSSWLVSLLVPIGAILGMTAAVARWIWPKVRASIIGEIRSQVDEAIRPVRSEVTTNAGKSMKDQLCRVEVELRELDRKLASLGVHVDGLADIPHRLAEVDRRLDAHIDSLDPRRWWRYRQ